MKKHAKLVTTGEAGNVGFFKKLKVLPSSK